MEPSPMPLSPRAGRAADRPRMVGREIQKPQRGDTKNHHQGSAKSQPAPWRQMYLQFANSCQRRRLLPGLVPVLLHQAED